MSKHDQLLSANFKEPIQHLPFFSSADLQIDTAFDQES